MDCSPPGSSVHEIFQARILEWVAISFSRGSSQPRDRTQVSCTAGRFFTDWATRTWVRWLSISLWCDRRPEWTVQGCYGDPGFQASSTLRLHHPQCVTLYSWSNVATWTPALMPAFQSTGREERTAHTYSSESLLRVPWTARRSDQSILKEISPEYSLKGLMLKLKLQYFGHLMGRDDSVTLMLGKIEGGRRRGWQRMRWLGGITDSMDMSLSNPRRWWRTGKPGVLQSMGLQRARHDWVTDTFTFTHNVEFTTLTRVDKSGPFSALAIFCKQHLCLVSEPSHALRRRLGPHELSCHLPQPPHHEPNFCLCIGLFLTFPIDVITHCMCSSVSASYTLSAVSFSNHRKPTPHSQKILEGSRFAKWRGGPQSGWGYSTSDPGSKASHHLWKISVCAFPMIMLFFFFQLNDPHPMISFAKFLQSCLTLCDPMDCSPPGTSVHGIVQARILEWAAISCSRRSSRLRDWTHASYISCTAGGFFTAKPLGKSC